MSKRAQVIGLLSTEQGTTLDDLVKATGWIPHTTALGNLSLDVLRSRWHTETGRTAPAHLPKGLLLWILTYRMQANIFGNLGSATLRFVQQSAVLAQGETDPGEVKRVSALDVEATITTALQTRFANHPDPATLVANYVSRAVIKSDCIDLTLTNGETIAIPWSRAANNPRREILAPAASDVSRAMKAEARVVLLRSIVTGQAWLDQIMQVSSADRRRLPAERVAASGMSNG